VSCVRSALLCPAQDRAAPKFRSVFNAAATRYARCSEFLHVPTTFLSVSECVRSSAASAVVAAAAERFAVSIIDCFMHALGRAENASDINIVCVVFREDYLIQPRADRPACHHCRL
jgi:hypothetical protein